MSKQKGHMVVHLPQATKTEVPEEIQEKCIDILSKAKIRLLRHRFFGSMSLTMEYKSVPGLGTYATDGKYIYYDPFTVVEEGTVKDAVSSIVHEVLHKIFLHFMRKEILLGEDNKLIRKLNYAADLAINPILKDEGFYLNPETFIYLPKYHGWSTERIFNDLRDEDVPQQVDCHLYVPSSAENEDQAASQDEMEAMKAVVEGQILNAAISADTFGLKSNSLKELIKGLKKSQVDWKAKLFRKVQGNNPEDYSWARPNRRYLHQGLYMPSVEKKGVGTIYIWPDSSGSISNKEAEVIASEMKYILEHIKPQKTVIVHCDARVHGTTEFTHGEVPASFDFIGRGGTDPGPFFEYVNEQGDAHCAVCLTDLYFDKSIPAPIYPTIWVSVSKETAIPFGDLVQISVDEA